MYLYMLIINEKLDTVFSESIDKLPCHKNTKAYITNILISPNKEGGDFSKASLTLIYSKAKFEYNFELFQLLGDWILFCETVFPENLNNASKEYYQEIARDSYYRCYKMINKKWLLFEELADRFPILVSRLQITKTVLQNPAQEQLLFPLTHI